MPPLNLFNRRWNIATDDFVYFSLVELILILPLIFIYIFYVDISETPFRCKLDFFYKIIYFGLGISISCNMLLTLALLYLSAQGTIMDVSKRIGVPYCIYSKFIILTVEIVFASFGFSLQYQSRRLLGDCNVKIYNIFRIIFYSFLVCLFIYIFIFWLYYEKFGNVKVSQRSSISASLSEIADNIKKRKIWRRKLQCLLCMHRPSFEERIALDDMAEILATINKQSNLVWSDYQTGLYIMATEDKNLDHLNGLKIKVDQHSSDIFLLESNGVRENIPNVNINNNVDKCRQNIDCKLSQKCFISKIIKALKLNISNNATYGIDLENKVEEYDSIQNPSFSDQLLNVHGNLTRLQLVSLLSNQSKIGFKLTNWRDLRFVYYFSTVAKASYGWPLNLLFRDKSDSCLKMYRDICCKCSLTCCNSKCICCVRDFYNSQNHHIIYPKGKLCAKHIYAIINKTHLKKEELICVSFYNKEFYSPFFVAISNEMKVIILSIRGSFSMKDILTDLYASLVEFEEDYLVGCSAHSGMTKSAYKLKHTLINSNIISGVMEKNKDYRLILTGHSLGAGIAVILACLLYNDYPNLKCYAYGIPMGTVNYKMAEFCKDFVLTVINGFDWISRLSLNSIKMTQNRLNDCLLNCPNPKYKITALMFILSKAYSISDGYKWNLLNVFKRNGDSQNHIDTEMKLPGQIIHIINIASLTYPRNAKPLFIPMITSSKEFDALFVRCDMFKDHFPSSYINNLYNIIKVNGIVTSKCHHFLNHYWPTNIANDDMVLPSLDFLNDNTLSNNNDIETVLKITEVITVV